MDKKKAIRKNYFNKRKKNFFQISQKFFKPFINLVKKKYKKNINISLYYPSNFEVNILKILEIDYFKKFYFSLPVVEKNQEMSFYEWKKNDILFVNKYGILEPKISRKLIPDVILVPLLAFDINKNRIGYGKGYYDRFLNQFKKKNKKPLTVGVAFSFQKYHNLPVNKKDIKLDYVLTEKGIMK